jgi:hypothetical protein
VTLLDLLGRRGRKRRAGSAGEGERQVEFAPLAAQFEDDLLAGFGVPHSALDVEAIGDGPVGDKEDLVADFDARAGSRCLRVDGGYHDELARAGFRDGLVLALEAMGDAGDLGDPTTQEFLLVDALGEQVYVANWQSEARAFARNPR